MTSSGLAFCSQFYRTHSVLDVPESVYDKLSQGLKNLGVTPLFRKVSEEEYAKSKNSYSFTFEQDKDVGAPPPQDKSKHATS
jgi:hypothetical protein